MYLVRVPLDQITRLVTHAVTDGGDTDVALLHAPQEDMNAATDETVKMHKAKMDKLFQLQQEKAMKDGYVHDVQVEFAVS